MFRTLSLTLAALAAAQCLEAASCNPIVTFADGKTPLREIFVAPTGHDQNGDGSNGRPYATLGRATRDARPGDALRLLPGTYPGGGSLSGLAGTAEHPIWIGGISSEARPVFEGGNQALHLSKVRYLVVENLHVRGATQNGINCDDGGAYADPEATRHVVFRGLKFENVGRGGNQDCLKLSGLDDYFVLECEFVRGSAGGSGIDQVGCHRGVIARCAFTEMGGNAIQCKGGSQNIEIRWNKFRETGGRAINIGGSTGFQFFRPPLSKTQPNVEARNIRVVANVFEGDETPVAFVGTVASLVANNTIVNPRRWIVRILQETVSRNEYDFLPCGKNSFVNNLVYFDSSRLSTAVNVGPNTAPGSFQFSHNLWFAHDRPERSVPGLPVEETGSVTGLDPGFVNAAQADFAVRAGSPAAGKGAAWPGVKADFRERCYRVPPSIGAFEAAPAE